MGTKENLTIAEWAEMSRAIAVEHGWWETDRNVGEQVALMHSELSEALEEWRTGNPLPHVYYRADGKPEGFGVELADCVIRIMDTCMAYTIDLEEMIRIKTEFNRNRPYRHGGKIA